MEQHAGRSLDWFFRQWIYEPGFPAYDVAWSWDEPSKRLRLRVRQTQAGATFRMPLDVEFKNGDAVRRETVEIKRARTELRLQARKQAAVGRRRPRRVGLEVADPAGNEVERLERRLRRADEQENEKA